MSSLRASMSGKMSSGKFSRGRNKSNADDLAARQAAGSRVLAERHAKELKQEEGLLSEELVEFSQQMMRFGLPLHLVCLFVVRVQLIGHARNNM